jgi:hypothetical protein
MRYTLLFAGIASAASGLAAQPDTSDYTPKETRRLMFDYAKCVVGRREAMASQAILANVDNGAIMKSYPKLIDGACLVRETHADSKMSFKGDLYRYALADALVNRQLANVPAPNLANAPPLPQRAISDEPKPPAANSSKSEQRKYEAALRNYEQEQGFRALTAYGECIVRTDTAGARTLLLTAPETPAEAAGFTAIHPALEQCLPEGETLAFGKVVLRGSIAVNYYRLAKAVAAHPVG